jgi:hypothetical protein
MVSVALPPEECCKTVFLLAGTRGGVGKTLLACNLFDWLRFRCSPSVAVRGFDLDPHGGLSRFYPGLERVGGFKPRELLGLIVGDRVHSCFLIDSPGGGEGLLQSVFSGYHPADLAFEGIRVVLVAPVTGDTTSLKNLSSWMQFAGAEIVLVYRWPAVQVGRQCGDLKDLVDLPLPLWLELAAGGAQAVSTDAGDRQEGRIKRVIQPQFKPEALVEHLFNRGISLYQAAYPYSAWVRRELSTAEELKRRREMNIAVGQYWGPKRRYWGVGSYFGHQLAVSLGFFHRQLTDVFLPLIADVGRPCLFMHYEEQKYR